MFLPRPRLLLFGLTVVGLAAPLRLAAQTVVVRTVEDSTGAVLSGTLVRLLRDGRLVAEGLTDHRGVVSLEAGATGSFVLRADRIGYDGAGPFAITVRRAVTESRIVMPRGRFELPPLVVQAQNRCGSITENQAGAARLWTQVRTALSATRIGAASPEGFWISTHRRDVSPHMAVRAEWSEGERIGHGTPFGTLEAAVLLRDGFVQRERDSLVYYAPDASLLLDESFLEGHCFDVVAPPDSLGGHVGLAFRPVRDRKVPEVQGVLWVDRASLELRLLEFEFVGGPPVQEPPGGGWIRFQRAPWGLWYITEWALVMPHIARVRSVPGSAVRKTPRDSLIGWIVRTGSAEPAAQPRAAREAAVLRGQITDSLRGGGLPGVLIIVGTADTAVTDAAGRYSLQTLATGRRIVRYVHRDLDLAPGRSSRVLLLEPSDTTEANVSTASPAELARGWCDGDFGGAAVVGRVSDDSLTVGLSWFETTAGGAMVRRTETAQPRPDGTWAACHLPPGETITVRTQRRSRVLHERAVNLRWKEVAWVEG